jgi:hypothetical protein
MGTDCVALESSERSYLRAETEERRLHTIAAIANFIGHLNKMYDHGDAQVADRVAENIVDILIPIINHYCEDRREFSQYYIEPIAGAWRARTAAAKKGAP